MQRKATIEEKIRIRKKEKAKKRGVKNRRMEQGQPRKKKLRLEEGLETAEENELSIATSPAEKRKVGKVEEKPSKRTRGNYDIKRYISQGWKRETPHQRPTKERTGEE